MTARKLALALGIPLLLGAGFYAAFSFPQVFAPGASQASGPQASSPSALAFTPVGLTPDEVTSRQSRGERVVLADVRGQASFESRHIEGARSMPPSEIRSWGPKLSDAELVVFYCS